MKTIKEIKLEANISDKILDLCLNVQGDGEQYTFHDLQGITEAMAIDLIKIVRGNNDV